MEKITTDIFSFENLRRGGFVYVDKTDLLWRLAAMKEGCQFFISRPRRFGKSLMLSTLQCIFEGRRELFKGLRIDKLGYDWKKYPVVMLNMAEVVAPTVDKLRENLSDMVDGLVEEFGLGRIRRVSDPGKSLGYSPKEIAVNFPRRLNALAKRLKTDGKGALRQLLDWYDSYRFSPESTARVCNPISIGKALAARSIQNYWAKTASASLVMERIAAPGGSTASCRFRRPSSTRSSRRGSSSGCSSSSSTSRRRRRCGRSARRATPTPTKATSAP